MEIRNIKCVWKNSDGQRWRQVSEENGFWKRITGTAKQC